MFDNLRIEHITKAMLRDALEDNTFWNKAIAPFPKSKALWLIANDRIEENEYCAVIGFNNDEMVSFLFLFPDLMNSEEASVPKKVYWMILWWVDKKYEDTILGSYVFNEALRVTDKQVLIKSYAEKVNSFYEKQPFDTITSRLRYTLFFGVDPSIIIGRWSIMNTFKFFLYPIEGLTAALSRILNKYKLPDVVKTLEYDYISALDNEVWEYIAPLCQDDLIYKTKSYIDWQLNPMQYNCIPIPQKQKYTSLLAGSSQRIKIQTVKIKQNNKIIGFLSYIVNHKELNIKYFLVKEECHYEACVAALMEHFIIEKTNFIFTDDTKLYEAINKQYFAIFVYKKRKKGLAHREMKLEGSKLNFFNRDGHFY